MKTSTSTLRQRALSNISRGMTYKAQLFDETFPPKIKDIKVEVDCEKNTVSYKNKQYKLSHGCTLNSQNMLEITATVDKNRFIKISTWNVYM